MARSMRNIDLNLLPVFSALMRDKNLSHSAKNLGMTQPAVSQALKRLRSLYNDPLFERKGGKMEPTLKAASIAVSIEDILNNVVETLPEQMDFVPETSKKHFQINMRGVPHGLFMTKVIQKLEKVAPSVSLTVHEKEVDDIEKSLREREFDLQIDYTPDDLPSCHQQVIFSDALYVIASKNHPRVGMLNEITLEQYLAEAHAVLLPRTNNIYPIQRAIKNLNFEREIRYTNSSMRNIIETVGKTNYLCIMPLGMLNSMANSENYVYFTPPFTTIEINMFMSWHWGTQHHQSLNWLRNLIIETCKEVDEAALQ
ncbi:LysR substrate-binding domain-containing protein [Colwelliaceae bacterium BS250]